MRRAGRRSAVLISLTVLACSDPLEPSDLVGTWGGEHVEVAFDTAGSGTIQYDCAHGRIAAPITLGPAGAWRAAGEHTREHGVRCMKTKWRTLILPSTPERYVATG